MTKAEFLEQLRLSLNGRLDANQVMDNLRYYEEYINSQLRQGKTEEDVMSMLGSPRLIARTITDANSDGASGGYASDAYGQYSQGGYAQGNNGQAGTGWGQTFERYAQQSQAQDAQGWDGDGYAERDQQAWDQFAQGPFGQAFFNRTRQEVTNQNNSGAHSLLVKFFLLPRGLRKVIGVAIAIALLFLFFSILKFLFPILLIGGIALFLVKLFRDWLR